jgi:hypothetical protein
VKSGLLVIAALALPQIALAQDVLTFATGFDYTSGKYGGTVKTDILYVPFSAKYETGSWIFKGTVPYVHVTGAANVVGAGADRVTLPEGSTERRSASGLGDIVGSAFYNVLSEPGAPVGLDLGIKVKLGTADDTKGLGTGKTDYSFQADAFKVLGTVTAFGSFGYRVYGDPEGVDLKNVFYGSVGGSYKLSAQTSVGLAYDFRPAITPGGGKVSELSAFVSQRLSREWKLQVYGVTGFADASPDFGIGAQLSYSY